MSEKFIFTDEVNPVVGQNGRPSEAVSWIYYNEKTKELLVGLAESEKAYLYHGVPVHAFSGFKNAVSKGYYYSTLVKRNYGPGDFFAWSDDVRVEKAQDAKVTAIGTPKGLTTNENTIVSSSVLAFPLKTEDKSYKSDGAVFDDAKSTSVVFNMGGDDKTVDFNDKKTVKDAVAEISRIADMLGLGSSLLIKSVTVHFE